MIFNCNIVLDNKYVSAKYIGFFLVGSSMANSKIIFCQHDIFTG